MAALGAAEQAASSEFVPHIMPATHAVDEAALCAALDAEFGRVAGHDSEGHVYGSITDLWNYEQSDTKEEEAQVPGQAQEAGGEVSAWYGDALDYWDRCDPTVDGVLGGYPELSPPDIVGSSAFLKKLWERRPSLGRNRAIDCGAGIGRVTKHLLLPLFEDVHLLEQSPPLIAAAPAYLGPEDAARTRLLCD